MYTKFLNIDSTHRVSGPSHNARFNVTPSVSFHYCRIAALTIPLVDFIAKGLVITLNTGTVSILDGIYTSLTLPAEIDAAFLVAGFTTTTVFDESTYRLTITSTAPFSILGVTSDILGFTTSPLGLVHTATNAINLSQPPVIGIRINEIHQDARNVSSVGGPQTFLVYSKGNSGDYLLFSAHSDHYNDAPLGHTIYTINSLSISLTNMRTGEPYDLQGVNYTMMLELSSI